jgi:two-component system, NtrC family, response regulator AtoC
MKILVIDDEQLIRWSLEKHYSSLGYKVYTAETGEDGIKQFSLHSPDVVFVDNKLPHMQGLEVISKLKSINDEAMIVFMTAYGSIETAVKAIKLGASEYVNKPFSFHEIDIVIEDIRQKLKINRELQLLRRQQKDSVTFDQIIAESSRIKEIIQLSKKIAATDTTTILLLGESGTGKDLFARAIHNASSRKDKPFVTINCSSLPDTLLESELFGHEQGAFTDAKKLKKGFFEIAEGGTVFLDEIGEVNHATQVKLLSVLENKIVRRLGGTADIPVEIRIIAATNKDLKKSVEEKEFREDLYYRLKVFQITLPPLREHKEDISPLAKLFLCQFNTQFRKSITTIESSAIQVLNNYKWPGNVRELRNVIERAVILETNSVLHIENLPGEIINLSNEIIPDIREIDKKPGIVNNDKQVDNSASLYDMEKQAIINALEKTRYNQVRASRLLGITRDTLRYKMKKYSLKSKLG